MLKALGREGKVIYHLNEAHSALLALSLLERQIEGRGDKIPQEADVEAIRKLCVLRRTPPYPPVMIDSLETVHTYWGRNGRLSLKPRNLSMIKVLI